MSHIGQMAMHHIAQTNGGGGGRQHANIQPAPQIFDQKADGLAPAAIDIVREEMLERSEISSE
jgi:hypothetical protein